MVLTIPDELLSAWRRVTGSKENQIEKIKLVNQDELEHLSDSGYLKEIKWDNNGEELFKWN